MSFDPTLDMFATIRVSGADADLGAVPAIDAVIDILGLSGLLNVEVSGTAPTANQPTTIWVQPQVNSWAGNGTVSLWDANSASYQPASAAAFAAYLVALTGGAVVLTGTGVPLTGVGANGAVYLRNDAPGGTYYKVSGTWHLIPGTAIGSGPIGAQVGVATGTASAIVLTHAPAWTALVDGMQFPLTLPGSTPGLTAPTLNVDGLGALPLHTDTGGVPGAGQYTAGQRLMVAYSASNADFYIIGPVQQTSTPTFGGFAFLGQAGGTAQALTATGWPTVSVLSDGALFALRVSVNNTGAAPTLNVDSLGAAPITRSASTPLQSGDLVAGSLVWLRYNSATSSFILLQDVTLGNSYEAQRTGAPIYGAGTFGGTAQALTATLAPWPPNTLPTGACILGVVSATNTGAAPTLTVNQSAGGPTQTVNSGSPITIVAADGSALGASALIAGHIVLLRYDGAALRLVQDVTAANFSGVVPKRVSLVSVSNPTFAFLSTSVAFRVVLLGPGGSGGGSETNPAGGVGGSGGGAGARVEWTSIILPGLTAAITIGAGGASVAHGQNGNAGGTSIFTYNGTTLTATGGGGGLSPAIQYPIGGAGGNASGGTVNVGGEAGQRGGIATVGGGGGNGGTSLYGGGGRGGYINVAAATNGGFGAGGGGGSGGTGIYDPSGVGGSGLALVFEY